jgi:hypothetical protein
MLANWNAQRLHDQPIPLPGDIWVNTIGESKTPKIDTLGQL